MKVLSVVGNVVEIEFTDGDVNTLLNYAMNDILDKQVAEMSRPRRSSCSIYRDEADTILNNNNDDIPFDCYD